MGPEIALSYELLAKPSVTPDDAGIVDFLDARLCAAGFATTQFNKSETRNLWAIKGEQGPIICLAGHCDVVPPGDLSAWESDPYEPTQRNGFLYARGAADMKCALASLIIAAESIPKPSRFRLALLITSDEEGDATYGTRFVLDQLEERPHFALVGEPTSSEALGDFFKIGRRGSLSCRMQIKGVQGHVAYPEKAKNPIHHASAFIQELVELDFGPPHSPFEKATLQCSNIAAGSGAANVIPGTLELQFNLRFPTSVKPSAAQEIVEQLARAHNLNFDCQWNCSAMPFLTENTLLVESMQQSIKTLLAIEPSASVSGGTSDARFFAEFNIPVIEFGPVNKSIHAANEHVKADDLPKLTAVYRSFIDILSKKL